MIIIVRFTVTSAKTSFVSTGSKRITVQIHDKFPRFSPLVHHNRNNQRDFARAAASVEGNF